MCCELCIPQCCKLCLICFVIHSGTFFHAPSVSHCLETDLLATNQPKPTHDPKHNLTGIHENHHHDDIHKDNQLLMQDEAYHSDHGENYKKLKNYYIEKLFKEYGNGKDVLTLDGLVLLFEKLGFKELPDVNDRSDHSHDTHETDKHLHESDKHDLHESDKHLHESDKHLHEADKHLHETDNHKDSSDQIHYESRKPHPISQQSLGNELGQQSSTSPLKRIKREVNQGSADGDRSHHSHEECSSIYKQYDIVHKTEYTPDKFQSICPAIIYMLQKSICMERPYVLPQQEEQPGFASASPKVWGLSILAIFIISLVGLVGVIIIPVMNKVFYNHLLQFLVALAVGALSGDALLHMLPHGLQGKEEENNSDGGAEDKTHVYKGLCGLLGIYFFFFMERVLSIVTDIRRRRDKLKKMKSLKHADDSMETVIPLAQMRVEKSNCHDQIMGIHPGQKALTNYAEASPKLCIEASNSDEKEFDESEDPSFVLGHNHHGHSHDLPNSVSSIAWMVILGDGIHNISDGLAVGAAFASSITLGFSTTIAIFCHELPHEIGDFAVLLRAGMSWKQAVIYSSISSVLALIGAIVGVCVGNNGDASHWIFVCTAGIFLYIALVDMLPELTSVNTKRGENPFHHLFLQMMGLLLGAFIMFLIAIYEHDIKMMLD